jgi:hypothetical protein
MTTITDLNAGWDGKVNGEDVSEGVYYITYTATDFNGESISGHTYFHLIR